MHSKVNRASRRSCSWIQGKGSSYKKGKRKGGTGKGRTERRERRGDGKREEKRERKKEEEKREKGKGRGIQLGGQSWGKVASYRWGGWMPLILFNISWKFHVAKRVFISRLCHNKFLKFCAHLQQAINMQTYWIRSSAIARKDALQPIGLAGPDAVRDLLVHSRSIIFM